MRRFFFARSVAAIVLFAITAMSVAVADPPPPPPLAVWSAIKETVDLELTSMAILGNEGRRYTAHYNGRDCWITRD